MEQVDNIDRAEEVLRAVFAKTDMVHVKLREVEIDGRCGMIARPEDAIRQISAPLRRLDEVCRFIARDDERLAAVFRMHYVDNKTFAQVASYFRCSCTTVLRWRKKLVHLIASRIDVINALEAWVDGETAQLSGVGRWCGRVGRLD